MDELFSRGLEQVIRSERGEEWLAALWSLARPSLSIAQKY